jgi:hypothetical protein
VAITDAQLRTLALGTLLPGFDGISAPAWLLDLLDEGLAGSSCSNATSPTTPVRARLGSSAPCAALVPISSSRSTRRAAT